MGGLRSRRRGKRGEYMLRDHLRNLGWTADRVPLSGASQGFKGDVRFTLGQETYYAEVKNHRNSFKKIYDLYFEIADPYTLNLAYLDGELITISSKISDILFDWELYVPVEKFLTKKNARTFTKLKNMRKLLGEADILAIKDDRMPWIFFRFK